MRQLVVSICVIAAFGSAQAALGLDIPVRNAAAFRMALLRAQGGDTITIQAGLPIIGSFELPATAIGSSPITIRTSRYLSLPSRRITPADKSLLAQIVSVNNIPALTATPGAHDWNLVGLEIACTAYCDAAVRLGALETQLSDVPRGFVLDRLYIHGSEIGSKRGISLNSAHTTVKNSWISGFWSPWQDTQAILGWNGPGPFLIANNYLEAAGENIMFGGVVPSIPGLIPSDITVIGNHLNKPERWRFAPDKAVKNLFELKAAKRVTVQGNVLEGSWPSAQVGFAVLFTVRTNCERAVSIEDVIFKDNLIRRSTGGFLISGQDDLCPQEPGFLTRVRLDGNIVDVGRDVGLYYSWGPSAINVKQQAENVDIARNTILSRTSSIWFSESGTRNVDVFNNILGIVANYGVGGDGANAIDALSRFNPGGTLTGNIVTLEAWESRWYPAGNSFRPYLGLLRNPDAGDYGVATPALSASAPGLVQSVIYGADFDSISGILNDALSGAVLF